MVTWGGFVDGVAELSSKMRAHWVVDGLVASPLRDEWSDDARHIHLVWPLSTAGR